jgi:hypothetical protein
LRGENVTPQPYSGEFLYNGEVFDNIDDFDCTTKNDGLQLFEKLK